MQTIALVLGDNDYGNTVHPLLESLYRALVWNGAWSRDAVERVVRSGLEFHYLAFQHGCDAQGAQATPEALAHTVAYLQQKLRILFDEDAEADIQGAGHDSGAWYIELATGKVYSY